MKIGIIGAGHIGANAARLFIDAGHEVAISNSRGPETLLDLVAELGPNRAASSAVAADALRGKIAIDAMNYYANRDGHYAQLDNGETTSSEMVAAHLQGARVVKAFNTIWFEHLKSLGNKNAPVEQRRVIPISGDDAEAKHVVANLIEQIGFGPLDLGPLRESARQQPGAPIYNNDVTVAEARGIAK